MLKITDLNEFSQMVAEEELYRNHINKAKKEIKKTRIKEMIAEGVDPEIAKVMVQVGL